MRIKKGSPYSKGSWLLLALPRWWRRGTSGELTRLPPHRSTILWSQRILLSLVLLLGWGWIMANVGFLLYRGRDIHDHHLHFHQQENQPFLVSGGNRTAPRAATGSFAPGSSPLLIFTCRRAEYLQKTLDDILKYIPKDCRMGCPIYISQDGNDPQVRQVIQQYQTQFQQQQLPLVHIQHVSALRPGNNAYQALAVHYGWALGQVMEEYYAKAAASDHPLTRVVPQRVVILEEDIHVAADFFDYFSALAPVLDADPTLLAVSAFNDNGYQGRVQDPTRVLRSDFFPGLGWMMTRRLWINQLKASWPPGYWDDWLRDPAQRQGRHILRPEISRTFHFGVAGGASQNQFGQHLSNILLNPTPVDWTRQDFSYLEEDVYDQQYWHMIQAATTCSSVEEAKSKIAQGPVRLEYRSFREFQQYARALQLMEDEKAGIPRTAYKGVVETRLPGQPHLLFLTPPWSELEMDLVAAAQHPAAVA